MKSYTVMIELTAIDGAAPANLVGWWYEEKVEATSPGLALRAVERGACWETELRRRKGLQQTIGRVGIITKISPPR